MTLHWKLQTLTTLLAKLFESNPAPVKVMDYPPAYELAGGEEIEASKVTVKEASPALVKEANPFDPSTTITLYVPAATFSKSKSLSPEAPVLWFSEITFPSVSNNCKIKSEAAEIPVPETLTVKVDPEREEVGAALTVGPSVAA